MLRASRHCFSMSFGFSLRGPLIVRCSVSHVIDMNSRERLQATDLFDKLGEISTCPEYSLVSM